MTQEQQVFCFGEAVMYLSRKTGQWIPAVVQGHVMVGKELHYNLDVQESAHPSRVMPRDSPPSQISLAQPTDEAPSGQHEVLCFGEHVQYLSRSTGEWIPAIVQGHLMVGQELHYNLDVQEAAPPSRVRPFKDSKDFSHAIPGSNALTSAPNSKPIYSSAAADAEQALVKPSPPANQVCPPAVAPRPKASSRKTLAEHLEELRGEQAEPPLKEAERVERPSELFSLKTFLDEPHFGASTDMSLNLSLNKLEAQEHVEEKVCQHQSSVPRVDRISDLFSQKSFLDEPHFGLRTSDSLTSDRKKDLESCSDLEKQANAAKACVFA